MIRSLSDWVLGWLSLSLLPAQGFSLPKVTPGPAGASKSFSNPPEVFSAAASPASMNLAFVR